MLPTLNTLWVGGHLTWVEAVCLAAAVRHGHKTILWCYQPVSGVPDGVVVADAERVLPFSQMVFHEKKQSWGVGADLFRVELQKHQLGPWIDADVYLLRPIWIDPATPLFGLQKPGLINNAVLYLPCDHEILRGLSSLLAGDELVPWWYPAWKRRLHSLRRRLSRRPIPLSRQIWGITGPRALTFVAKELGYLDAAAPPDVFYPFGPKEAQISFEPASVVEARLTNNTIGVHLWNAQIADRKGRSPPAGSFADKICKWEGIQGVA
ncbi:MAG: hypothetical protein AAF580_07525 [Pseudomonadota bacterium]